METQAYDRMRLYSALMKIGHGDLGLFVKDGLDAARTDSEFFGHLIAWNNVNGKVRDSKIAFPPLAMRGLTKSDADLAENAVGHMVSLDPTSLVKSYQFSSELTKQGHTIPAGYRRLVEQGLKRYLEVREAHRKWWDSSVVRHRAAMKTLYAVSHRQQAPFVKRILFEGQYPKDSVFAAIANLRNMGPTDAAAAILTFGIPVPIAIGALGSAKNDDVTLALIEGMTGNELINNSDMLRRLGAMDSPMLKAAYDAAIERAKTDTRVSALKATKAAKKVGGAAGKKLLAVQQAQVEALGDIEGNWLVLGDRSGSMGQSIEVAKHIAALIAERVRGEVHLVFFNTSPDYFEITGKTLAQVQDSTKRVFANGGTSIGCGLAYALDKGLLVNGIAIVSDGAENQVPWLGDTYQRYITKMGIEPSIYLFVLPGEPNVLTRNCERAGIPLTTYELGDSVDYYSLPNLVKVLKTRRFGLLDEIMGTSLLTLEQVFTQAQD